MNEVARHDIDASRWLAHDQTERLAPHLAGADELLLVAARQGPGRRLGLGRSHVVLFHAPPRRLGNRPRCGQPAAGKGGPSLVAEDRVFLGGKLGNQRHAEAILGDMGEPERAPGIDNERGRLMPGDA